MLILTFILWKLPIPFSGESPMQALSKLSYWSCLDLLYLELFLVVLLIYLLSDGWVLKTINFLLTYSNSWLMFKYIKCFSLGRYSSSTHQLTPTLLFRKLSGLFNSLEFVTCHIDFFLIRKAARRTSERCVEFLAYCKSGVPKVAFLATSTLWFLLHLNFEHLLW